jgi:hypothetical protein
MVRDIDLIGDINIFKMKSDHCKDQIFQLFQALSPVRIELDIRHKLKQRYKKRMESPLNI